jgi:hypothetical protein
MSDNIVQGFHESDLPKVQKRVNYIDRRFKEVLSAEKWAVKKGELTFQTRRVKFDKLSGWFDIKYEISQDDLEFDLVVEFRACSTPIKLVSKIQDKTVAECKSKKDFRRFWVKLEGVMENDLALTVLDGYIRDAVRGTKTALGKISKYDLRYTLPFDDPKVVAIRTSTKIGYGYTVRNLNSISINIDFDSGNLKIVGPCDTNRTVSIGDPEIVQSLIETLDETFETSVQAAIDKDFIDKFQLNNADEHIERMKFICNTLGRRPNTEAVLAKIASFRRKVESF